MSGGLRLLIYFKTFGLLSFCADSSSVFMFTERSMSYSDESRLSNLLRRITREDDRDRRLATVKQLKEFIQQPENKLVSIVCLEILISFAYP